MAARTSLLLAGAGLLLVLGMAPLMAESSPPDLTRGEAPIDWKGKELDPLTKDINLGPTGLKGWIYHKGVDSSMSRQILITEVTEGSPAAGILSAQDVILGVDGTGVRPEPFSGDPRHAFGLAIGEAEARDPAVLNLLVWRSGKASVKSLKLQTLGAYSPTAPYGCAKSAAILEQGIQHLMAEQNEGSWSLNSLPLLAANNPEHPENAARQARAREWARQLILPQEEIVKRLNGHVSTHSKVGWTRGHELLVLAEYYLHSQDDEVFPTIEAMAVEICNGFSHLGTMGHQFTNPVTNGEFNGPYNIGYGAINSAGLPSYFGLLLARKCGVKRPELGPAIARATNFFGSFTGYGAIPYGEHLPARNSHESNGKMGLAALAMSVEGSRKDSAKYFSKMATASASEREVGHCGAFFNYLWAPLGANVGGPEAAASHFDRIRWRLDLNRRWDGGFDYDCWYHYSTGGPRYAGRDFWASIPMLLTYATPLQQLTITGKDQDVSLHLWSDEIGEAEFADTYDPSARSTRYLFLDLALWSPKVQQAAAIELAKRKEERDTLLPALIAIARNPDAGEQRVGACFALGEMKDGRAAPALAALVTDADEKVRYAATYAMRHMPKENQLEHLDTLLKAAASTIRPFDPLTDRIPLQFAHSQLSYLLFYNGNAYGPRGVISGDQIKDIDRELLYPAIRAVAQTPLGHPRGSLSGTFPHLSDEDVIALSGTLIDTARIPAPADKMFKSASRTSALDTLQDHGIAEGVMVAARLAMDPSFGKRSHALEKLAEYGASSVQAGFGSDIQEVCEYLSKRDPNLADQALAVLQAIRADRDPKPLIRLKTIESVTASSPRLTLPDRRTELSVEASNPAGGSIYTWRKVHGAGAVSFSDNGTPTANRTTVEFGETPGKYLLEVTLSDSRGLTEARGQVGVILQDRKGALPPNRPPVADRQKIAIAQSTTTPVRLKAADPEQLEIQYAITTFPAHGKLSGDAPNLIYTPDYGYSGSDRFTYRVTDSEGQSAEGIVELQVAQSPSLQVAIYEPFAYEPGSLDGQSGRHEIGLAGSWSARKDNAMIRSGSLSYAGLPTVGGKYEPEGGNSWGGAREILPSALKANGLLDDGAVLWFSAVVGYGSEANYKWDRLSFALANNRFNMGNATTYIQDEGSRKGLGIGFTMFKHDSHATGGRVQATRFQDKSLDTGNSKPDIHGSWDQMPTLIPEGGHGLVVGRITWATDPQQEDVIEIFGPMSDLKLPSEPVSMLRTIVDQSDFDTLTFCKGGHVLLDEIRFGPSYESVLAGTVPMKR
ncbi:MAG: DUF6288 domain-containing protein [Akkermansiaceae bacterium]|nr:DUF6288 domain-containing protein [Akkermansiaceae bacterium]